MAGWTYYGDRLKSSRAEFCPLCHKGIEGDVTAHIREAAQMRALEEAAARHRVRSS